METQKLQLKMKSLGHQFCANPIVINPLMFIVVWGLYYLVSVVSR
ncbi:MAG: hypothetical protein ABIH21_01340 [Patescibacteria group bacterium]